MNIDGSCHCGQITYTATIDPDRVAICHCTDCQTFSGSAFRIAALAPKDGFRLLSGEPRLYVKTTDSGKRRVQAFCPDCGTALYACAESDPQFFSIRVGTARQRRELIPKVQVWCRSALDWVTDLGSMRAFDEQPPIRL